MIIMKRKNAAEIEASYAQETSIEVVDPNNKPSNQHSSLNYPVYDEYREFGRNYKPKEKK